jgi:hypothetical protein
MTRLILAAGVAALAIAGAAEAKPGGGGGGGNPHSNGGGGPPAAQADGGGHGKGSGGARGGGGGGGGAAPAVFGGGGGRGHGGGSAAPQMRVERQQFRGPQVQRAERQQFRGPQVQRAERQQVRQQARGFERQQARAVQHQQADQQSRGFERQQARAVQRQQVHQQQRGFERQQARQVDRQQIRGNRAQQAQQQGFAPQQFGGGERFNGKQAKFAERQFAQNVNPASYRALTYANDVAVVPAYQVERFVGVPVAQVASFASLSPFPASMQYLYPSTPDYYYQYGNGYAYQIDRSSSLIDALIPLLAGGYLPGQYLPQPYMASYVPNYYGMNSFYPDYGNTCNRYANGVIYEVDCATGYVENVIPMYASGYGVGQILPSAYSYYNVPTQYRSMYYDTPDYGYWYSPGAIYQYDQRSSMITSVAALMAPGFTVGQQVPLGYDVYNVPYDYRATYYDTANASYRYNNGYIYQVDPMTQVVTAIVASLLT